MSLKESAELYLETIYTLSKTHSYVRSIDVAEALGYSRPSVSRAVGLLKKDGYLSVKEEGFLILTEKGMEAAENIYERHTILTAALVALGVDPETAAVFLPYFLHRISHTFNICFDALVWNMLFIRDSRNPPFQVHHRSHTGNVIHKFHNTVTAFFAVHSFDHKDFRGSHMFQLFLSGFVITCTAATAFPP